MSDKLVFHRPTNARKHNKSCIVRLTEEAYELLIDRERATGHSLTYLASEMIKFADDRAVLSDDDDPEEDTE